MGTKKVLCVIAATLLLSSNIALAEESISTDLFQTEAVTTETSPVEPAQSVETKTAEPQSNSDTLQETALPTEPADTPETITPNETPTEEPTGPAQAPTQDPTQSPTHEPEQEPTPAPADVPHLQATLTWETDSEDGILYPGTQITLTAEIAPDFAALRLQWQLTKKPAEALKENEPEWSDIPGERSPNYTFIIADGMQTWRWRLCMTAPDGESIYSDEIMLPAIKEVGKVLGVSDGEPTPEPEPIEQPTVLPVANIAFTASVPDGEITHGTEITLTAEIENPVEGMQLQWQHLPASAEPTEDAWINVEGATEATYTYMLSEENEDWLWRLLITVPEALEPMEEASSGEEVTTNDENPPEEPTSTDIPMAPEETEAK